MDQDRRSFLKSAGCVGAATLAATMTAETSAVGQASGEGGKLSELNRLDAAEIASRIARRKVSPVEVIDAALARLEATEPALNAFVAIDSDGARRAARAAEVAVMRGDALGPLHGVPVSVKDLIDVAGLPARCGSLPMKDNVARADAPSVERLRRAGAIILGKTATPEFGYQDRTNSLLHGNTRNPNDAGQSARPMNRATTIGAECDRRHAGRNGGNRAAARPARREAEIRIGALISALSCVREQLGPLLRAQGRQGLVSAHPEQHTPARVRPVQTAHRGRPTTFEHDLVTYPERGTVRSGNAVRHEGEERPAVRRRSGADLDWAAVTRTLIEDMPWRVETARLFGREMIVPRMTAWFGDAAYRYSGILHQPAPMPAIVHSLRERAEELSGASFNSVLLNLYRNGRDSVEWHSDYEAGLGERPMIASLSLGGARRFQFRHRRRKETITLELKSGDWLMMRGETQRFWVHQVPKTASPVDPRVNLTFRRMIS